MQAQDGNPLPSLEQFPRIPRAGKIALAESHSEIHSLPSNPDNPMTASGFLPVVAQYTITSQQEITSRLPFKIPSIKISSNKASIIVPREQGIAKAVWDAWWDEGLKGVYECLEKANDSGSGGNATAILVKIISSATAICVKIVDAPSKFLAIWFPHLEWKTEDIHEKFSKIRGWKESWVRVQEWHPNAPLMAVALNDDSVRLCFVGHNDVPILRCQEQVNVSCLSWRPIVTTELAVGCDNCIVIWYLTSSASIKLAKDKTEILKVDGHGPINCVEYSPNGLYLLSSSAKDPSVYMWDTYTWSSAPLRRVSGGGISLTMYSPDGNRFLAASPTQTFWIWTVGEYWDCKRWSTPQTAIEAACWNPEGSVLLFATAGVIYGLFFKLSPVDKFVAQTDSLVKPIYNIDECHVLDEDENLAYKVGGKVRHMEWDKSGHRVALMFDDSEMIAVFRVIAQSRAEFLVPLGFIRGHADEYPLSMAFQKDFSDGAILAIVWSTGRIQYFPMIFALPTSERNMLHEDHYRTQGIIHGRPSIFTQSGFASTRLSTVAGADSSNISELYHEQVEATSPSRLYSVPTN